jgi:hypothetical protein
MHALFDRALGILNSKMAHCKAASVRAQFGSG